MKKNIFLVLAVLCWLFGIFLAFGFFNMDAGANTPIFNAISFIIIVGMTVAIGFLFFWLYSKNKKKSETALDSPEKNQDKKRFSIYLISILASLVLICGLSGIFAYRNTPIDETSIITNTKEEAKQVDEEIHEIKILLDGVCLVVSYQYEEYIDGSLSDSDFYESLLDTKEKIIDENSSKLYDIEDQYPDIEDYAHECSLYLTGCELLIEDVMENILTDGDNILTIINIQLGVLADQSEEVDNERIDFLLESGYTYDEIGSIFEITE